MANEALMAQLLQWVGSEPRDYRETIEAWRTSCPRLTIWEDAVSAGFVERLPATEMNEVAVQVTAEGHAWLRTRQAS